jgi:REP element-mobilizing transposase RayT
LLDHLELRREDLPKVAYRLLEPERISDKKIIVGDMIGAYKSIVANECLELWKSKRPDEMMGKLWQRNFFEHIIRDEQSLNNIREYVLHNPENWETDSENIGHG